MTLNEKQLRFLRGRAHALKPVVQIGQKALTPGNIAETRRALHDHELIKLRIQAGDRESRTALLQALVAAADCTLVTRIGHVAVLFKRNHASAKIILPAGASD